MTDSQAQQAIEYSVYTLESSPPGEENKNDPEKHSTTDDMDASLKEAAVLFNSGKYRKVEVKKKYFEEKTGRTVEMSLRLFEAKDKKDYSLILLVLLAVACGAIAFSLAFFLT